jgi:hypothetical protein
MTHNAAPDFSYLGLIPSTNSSTNERAKLGRRRVEPAVEARMEFVAKKGDVWTCIKGIGEDLEDVGSTVAIMRIIDLIPA